MMVARDAVHSLCTVGKPLRLFLCAFLIGFVLRAIGVVWGVCLDVLVDASIAD